jgi:hypothetical protein
MSLSSIQSTATPMPTLAGYKGYQWLLTEAQIRKFAKLLKVGKIIECSYCGALYLVIPCPSQEQNPIMQIDLSCECRHAVRFDSDTALVSYTRSRPVENVSIQASKPQPPEKF